MTVAFFMTRVKSPDEDDWGNLLQVLNYLNEMRYLKLKLSLVDLGLLKWFVDVTNMNWDCKQHGGAMFALGKEALSSYSRKLKLTTQSSTQRLNWQWQICTSMKYYGHYTSSKHRATILEVSLWSRLSRQH
jgi:hypothetical protein